MPSSGNSACPVCKAAVCQQTVVPIYVKDGDQDPRSSEVMAPNRPAAERDELQPLPVDENAAFSYGGGATRYSFAAGYGHFPVICSLAFCANPSLHTLPVGSQRAKLFIIFMLSIAGLSMLLM